MLLSRVRGINFKGLEAFDVDFPAESFCLVGPNMSGKSSTGHAVVWSLAGVFPYPGLGKFKKDHVRPDVKSGNPVLGTAKKKRSEKESGPTVVQSFLANPTGNPEDSADSAYAAIGRSGWVVTRAQIGDKPTLHVRDQDGVYSFYDAEAQEIIFGLFRIPPVGSLADRIELLLRHLWYGVGQGTSLFSAKPAERKDIVESIDPAKRLPAWFEEAKKRHATKTKEVTAIEAELNQMTGALAAQRSELARKLAPVSGRDVASLTAPGVAVVVGMTIIEESVRSPYGSLAAIDAKTEELRRQILTTEKAKTAKDSLVGLEAGYQEKLSELDRLGGEDAERALGVQLTGADREAAQATEELNRAEAIRKAALAESALLGDAIRRTTQADAALVRLAGAEEMAETTAKAIESLATMVASSALMARMAGAAQAAGHAQGQGAKLDALGRLGAALVGLAGPDDGQQPAKTTQPSGQQSDIQARLERVLGGYDHTLRVAAAAASLAADAAPGTIFEGLAVRLTGDSANGSDEAEREAMVAEATERQLTQGLRALRGLREQKDLLEKEAAALAVVPAQLAASEAELNSILAAAQTAMGDAAMAASLLDGMGEDDNAKADKGAAPAKDSAGVRRAVDIFVYESGKLFGSQVLGAKSPPGTHTSLGGLTEAVLVSVAASLSTSDELSKLVHQAEVEAAETKAQQLRLEAELKALGLQAQRYTKTAERAAGAAPGETPLCQECGSELSGEHLGRHLVQLTEQIRATEAAYAASPAATKKSAAALTAARAEHAKAAAELSGGLTVLDQIRLVCKTLVGALLASGQHPQFKNQASLTSQAGQTGSHLNQTPADTHADTHAYAKVISGELSRLASLRAECDQKMKAVLDSQAASLALVTTTLETALAGTGLPADKLATVAILEIESLLGELSAEAHTHATRHRRVAAEARARQDAAMGELASFLGGMSAARDALGGTHGVLAALGTARTELTAAMDEASASTKAAAIGLQAAIRDASSMVVAADTEASASEPAIDKDNVLGLLADVVLGLPGCQHSPADLATRAMDHMERLISSLRAQVGGTIDTARTQVASARSGLERLSSLKRDLGRQMEAIATHRTLVPLQMADFTATDFDNHSAALSQDISQVQRHREAAATMDDISRLTGLVRSHETEEASLRARQKLLTDELQSLEAIRKVLAPDGQARTMALAPSITAIVENTNKYLSRLNLEHTLAIDLRLEKGDDAKPAIDFIFEVDGSSSEWILPSESQRKIVSLCCDLAVAALRTRSGFIIIDEPETGLDELNKGRLTSFLRGLTPQTIMITNTASEGFGQAISTEQIRSSVAPGTLGLGDFGVVFKTKADPVPKKQKKDQEESTVDPFEMGSV